MVVAVVSSRMEVGQVVATPTTPVTSDRCFQQQAHLVVTVNYLAVVVVSSRMEATLMTSEE